MENTQQIEQPAIEAETTAPETDEPETTETEGEAEVEEQALLSLTQEEFDERIRKAAKKAAAIAERKTRQKIMADLQAQQVQREVKEIPPPKREHYQNEDEYIDARIAYRDALKSKEENAKLQVEYEQAMQEKAEELIEAAEEFPEFDRDSLLSLPFTEVMNEFVMESNKGAKILAYLSVNPDEQERIAKIKSPIRQAAEMAKLEDRIDSKPKKDAKPVDTVKGGTVSKPNLANMTQAQYEAYRAKQGALWARR